MILEVNLGKQQKLEYGLMLQVLMDQLGEFQMITIQHLLKNQIDIKCLMKVGKINFNFKEEGAKFNLYGCNTCSVKNENSFGKRISSLWNFSNVEVSGQPYSSYVSERKDSFYNPSGNARKNTYFVSQEQESLTPISRALPFEISPMKTFKNGLLIK